MSTERPIRKVLIANRGEIAVRVARACAELGIRSVAVASEADRRAMFTRVADEVIEIGPAPARDSYLAQEKILAAAKESGADAIHPGYGFLSQNAAFADAVEAAGIAFVGPSGDAMRVMGYKPSARRAMEEAGVPVVPGFQGTGDEDTATLQREADRIGYPLLVKAAAGGGGRGMRIVRESSELADAAESARREAEGAFGDGRLFLERFVEASRHVEFQVMADAHGTTLHLLERECSVQRRYQKIVEESPSPALDDALRAEMGQAAVRAAEACGYRNAGTIEFLLGADRSFYFLEMNTRLQVEHPVTELITGRDLVATQLRVAAGARLDFSQDDVKARGHAIECRVNAEDPGADFAPSTGPVLRADFPAGPGIRVDSGVETGDEIPIHYDSMIAKVLVHAESRPRAIERMLATLDRTAILGVQTNIDYLKTVLRHDVFRAGEATTTFVRDHLADWAPPSAPLDDDLAIVAAVAEFLAARSGGAAADGESTGGDRHSPWAQADGYRVGGSA